MSEIVSKIENKIKLQEKILVEIEKINNIITKNKDILSKDEINQLIEEKTVLETKVIRTNKSFDEKFKHLFCTNKDLEDLPPTQWLIPSVIPNNTIGVFIGTAGSGKTSVIISYFNEILKNNDKTYLIFINTEVVLSDSNKLIIQTLFNRYHERFRYAGKELNDMSLEYQILLQEIAEQQLKSPHIKYIIVGDSLTLISPRKNGFIEVEKLYKYEKKIRAAGGTIILIHHTNKAGIFADTQQIENYADYTYLVERNNFNSCILLTPKKASRHAIENKAYLTENRQIIKEIDFQTANISSQEASFVQIMIDLLSDGEMNQSEIIKYLKQISFFTKYSIGEKKVIAWLEKWANTGTWCCEKRLRDKNSKYYFLKQTEKLENLPNKDEMGIK